MLSSTPTSHIEKNSSPPRVLSTSLKRKRKTERKAEATCTPKRAMALRRASLLPKSIAAMHGFVLAARRHSNTNITRDGNVYNRRHELPNKTSVPWPWSELRYVPSRLMACTTAHATRYQVISSKTCRVRSFDISANTSKSIQSISSLAMLPTASKYP